ncbi:cytochrome b5 [Exidia glandulosa HHB12029]|uniref:Cytochrome b5 n=1 Tax=Exidia glandulosa HHB12029 TaxID=1314781 RepID=A0A165R2T3_EXIGL|nr:cytochrome b5 [Exidia glandulosa HHB12029]
MMPRTTDNSGAPPKPAPADPARPPSPKVLDATGRLVEDRASNRPFLAYQEYRKKEAEKRAEIAARRVEREEKIARGEDGGPAIHDPYEPVEIGLSHVLKFLVFVLLAVTLSGKFVTGSYKWGYEGKWSNIKTYFPSQMTVFSERRLAQFDGTYESKPIYLAIDGDVFDVSASRHTYGPGGSYHIMAGKDMARAFGTGCFKEHQTHDTRGMSEQELASLAHWKKFFAGHQKYFKVGRVVHEPIDPASPIPEPCNQPKKSEDAPKVYGPRRANDEL